MALKRGVYGVIGIAMTGALALSVMAARYQATYAAGTRIGTVDVSGLTPEEGVRKLKNWWGARQLDTYSLATPRLNSKLPPQTLIQWGARLDVEKTLGQLQPQEFSQSLTSSVGIGQANVVVKPILTIDPAAVTKIQKFVESNQPATAPARIRMEKGKLVRTPEQPSLALDTKAYEALILRMVETGEEGALPLTATGKKLTDEMFAKLKEPMVTFTTTFPVGGHRDRVNNIDVASGKIDGLILMPGDVFSFNETVGRRTIEAGFKEAPVFVNGRHDTGVGGGICQVSTTLYNAALRADLKIVERRNHSLPVAYVPAGRDATVSYGTTDFKIQNTYDFPIALVRSFRPGTLSWTIVGIKDPTLKVEIVNGPTKYFSHSPQVIRDRSLPAGRTVVVDKGAGGKTLKTWRLVYRNGKLVRRDDLGVSYYRGGPRILRVGSKPRPASDAPASPAPVAPPVAAPVP
jgi:vancomycin resistance protein YoaR